MLILVSSAGFVGIVSVVAYNGLVRARNAFKNAFAQIDVQLRRRYDLIPNLIETAKKTMAHEKETFEAVIAARNQARDAQRAAVSSPDDGEVMRKFLAAEGQLETSLSRMNVVLEAYPEIRSGSTMNQLIEELSSTENKIAFARQAYNDAVMTYNNKREVFPSSMIAGLFSFAPAQLYVIESVAESQPIKVNFQ